MKAFIDDHRNVDGVEPICKVLPIAPSSYREHAARRADPSQLPARTQRDAVLAIKVRRVINENFGVYRVQKVWRQMMRGELRRCPMYGLAPYAGDGTEGRRPG